MNKLVDATTKFETPRRRKFLQDQKEWNLIGIIICVISFIVTTFLPINTISKVLPYALIVILFKIFVQRFFNFWQGQVGERNVSKILHKIESIAVIDNVILPGNTGNVDHLLFTPQGIICVETKAFSGTITIYKNKWYQKTKTRGYEIKSPLNQVWGCKQNLKRFLEQNKIDASIILPGIVAFGINPDKVVWKHKEKRVLKAREIKGYIRKLSELPKKDRIELQKAHSLIKNLD